MNSSDHLTIPSLQLSQKQVSGSRIDRQFDLLMDKGFRPQVGFSYYSSLEKNFFGYDLVMLENFVLEGYNRVLELRGQLIRRKIHEELERKFQAELKDEEEISKEPFGFSEISTNQNVQRSTQESKINEKPTQNNWRSNLWDRLSLIGSDILPKRRSYSQNQRPKPKLHEREFGISEKSHLIEPKLWTKLQNNKKEKRQQKDIEEFEQVFEKMFIQSIQKLGVRMKICLNYRLNQTLDAYCRENKKTKIKNRKEEEK